MRTNLILIKNELISLFPSHTNIIHRIIWKLRCLEVAYNLCCVVINIPYIWNITKSWHIEGLHLIAIAVTTLHITCIRSTFYIHLTYICLTLHITQFQRSLDIENKYSRNFHEILLIYDRNFLLHLIIVYVIESCTEQSVRNFYNTTLLHHRNTKLSQHVMLPHLLIANKLWGYFGSLNLAFVINIIRDSKVSIFLTLILKNLNTNPVVIRNRHVVHR